MNVYDAIMKAADMVESNPDKFNFNATRVPDDCGSPGCALGWIGHFAGRPAKLRYEGYYGFSDVAISTLGLAADASWATDIFYDRMDVLLSAQTGKGYKVGGKLHDTAWRYDASVCASALRLYAVKYHAPAKPAFTGLPDIVRDIFKQRVAA